MRILVLEDDRLVASGLKQGLQQLGYTVDVAGSAEQAASYVASESFDLALVDIGLPGADGLSFIRRLRSQGNGLPALILSARAGMDETIAGLDAGADDYLCKPYRLPELAARMRALLRRTHARSDACLRHDGLCLDTRSRQAELHGKALELTNREWAILELLLLASPAVVGKEKLMQALTGWDKDVTPNAIEVHISRLRSKLQAGNIQIRTVRGIGYRVDAPLDDRA